MEINAVGTNYSN